MMSSHRTTMHFCPFKISFATIEASRPNRCPLPSTGVQCLHVKPRTAGPCSTDYRPSGYRKRNRCCGPQQPHKTVSEGFLAKTSVHCVQVGCLLLPDLWRAVAHEHHAKCLASNRPKLAMEDKEQLPCCRGCAWAIGWMGAGFVAAVVILEGYGGYGGEAGLQLQRKRVAQNGDKQAQKSNCVDPVHGTPASPRLAISDMACILKMS